MSARIALQYLAPSFRALPRTFKCGSATFSTAVRSCRSSAIPTIQAVIDQLTDGLGGQKLWRPKEYDRNNLLEMVPKTQEELPPRTMKDSYSEAVIPIGQDELLRQKYVNFVGGVRFGRILEDVDVFGILLCHKFVLNPKQTPGMPSPFCIVTALVDQIDMKGQMLAADQDIRLTGHVSWVGKSSIEVTVKLYQFRESVWREIIKARIVNVARDPLNRGSAFINPIRLESDEETAIFNQGEENKKRRQTFVDESLLKQPPSAEERALIHELFLKTVDHKNHNFNIRIKPPESVWMEETELSSVIICHPQERNRYNKIFGGFIMRQAYELAWANSNLFSKTRPIILHVDDIWFRKPVEIGSLLRFSSQVVYTNGSRLQVRVNAEVVDPLTGHHDITNVFHFTFTTLSGVEVKQVLPKSYSEAMLYLDERRHYEAAIAAPKT